MFDMELKVRIDALAMLVLFCFSIIGILSACGTYIPMQGFDSTMLTLWIIAALSSGIWFNYLLVHSNLINRGK